MARARRQNVGLGGHLQRARGETSLRQIERSSGINSGYLSQLEQGKITHPGPTVLQRVADAYGVRFDDALRWAGYAPDQTASATPNQEVALSMVSALGEPNDEELQTLRAIVDLLKRNRAATYTSPSDRPLEDEAAKEIRRYVLALLREADALGKRPTPLGEIREAARLVQAGELTLSPRDRARLVEQFGRWVDVAWKRLMGTFDFRAEAIWVKPDLHPMKQRFVLSHEIGHAILPAHRKTFAYIDDFTRLPPFARDAVEREANQAAAEILFQGGQLSDEVDNSKPSIRLICDQSVAFGASVVSTARYAAETSRRSLAAVIAHRNSNGLGPMHIYCSRLFETEFGWLSGRAPRLKLRTGLASAGDETSAIWALPTRSGEGRAVEVQPLDTGFAAILLFAPEQKRRTIRRKVAPPVFGRA